MRIKLNKNEESQEDGGENWIGNLNFLTPQSMFYPA